MDKSFGYNATKHEFRIARHQVGDFALHLSLARSFSWGDNFPPELPYFPGKPLPYHYYFDFAVGILEKAGLRIDYAFNGLSILAFTALLFLIYKLPQLIFKKNIFIGLISVALFIGNSSLTFVDFLRGKMLSFNLLRDLWFLPDYIHKGPFDNSLISIFFTLNVYLNQRHLITGVAIGLVIIYMLLSRIINRQKISWKLFILISAILGFSTRLHTLAALSTMLSLFFLLLFFKRFRWIPYIFFPALLIFSFHARIILNQDIAHSWWNPGFHAEKPLTLLSWSKYWLLNLGAASFTIPLGVYLSNQTQRKIFFSILPMFIIGNLFQLGFRIDHNHSLFNFFFIFANFYSAYFLIKLWNAATWKRIFSVLLLFLLVISGIINLMAVKNDFQFPVKDAPADKFIQWIKMETEKDAVFLAPPEQYDPVTLAGRKNYLGNSYYLEVMGYNFAERRERIQKSDLKTEGIDYLVMSVEKGIDKEELEIVYQDDKVVVFRL